MWLLQVTLIGVCLIFRCSASGNETYKFPKDFQFGAVTAAYAIEGGWNEDGKGHGFWDYIVHNETSLFRSRNPLEKLNKQELIRQGDVAADSYHKWREDIRVAKELGLDYYKFSITWSRILPRGFSNPINQAGIDYYNNLINGLLEAGITPIVTIFYYDGPESGDIFFGGFSNDISIRGFTEYANILFREFGDRVKQWVTFNEAYKYCKEIFGEFVGNGYEYFPSGSYEYLCGRNVLLAHASAYRLYEKKYKRQQKGQVSMAFALDWYEAIDDEVDTEAAQRALDFSFGWFAHPLVYGDYPQRMIDTIAEVSKKQNFTQSRLPPFSNEEKALIKGTLDVMILVPRNTYMAVEYKYVAFPPNAQNDVQIKRYIKKDWVDANSQETTTAWGFEKSIQYVWDNYGQREISISSVGYGAYHDSLNDEYRVKRLQEFLEKVLLLINVNKINIKYFSVWSLIDLFYFQYAYTVKFGLYQVNVDDPAKTRIPKLSAKYYKNVIKTRKLPELS